MEDTCQNNTCFQNKNLIDQNLSEKLEVNEMHFFTSALASFPFVPIRFTNLTASSMFAYLTAHNSLSIKSFTELCIGCGQLCIMRKLPSFFGTKPIGETRKVGKGGFIKGPAIRPILSSLSIFCLTKFGL